MNLRPWTPITPSTVKTPTTPSIDRFPSEDFLTEQEWVKRSQCDSRFPFCNLLGKKGYLYKPKDLDHWVKYFVNPMYHKITNIIGVNDISSVSAKKYPLFEATEAIFGKLLSAPMDTHVYREVPEFGVKLIGIILINHIKIQKDLNNAISF